MSVSWDKSSGESKQFESSEAFRLPAELKRLFNGICNDSRGGKPVNYVEQEIVLRTEPCYGRDVPLSLSAPLLRLPESIARPSVRRCLKEQARRWALSLVNVHPIFALWLRRKNGLSILYVKAPKLEKQLQLIRAAVVLVAASSEDTVIQVIGNIATVRRGNGQRFI
ncbi:MAG: hypothetical protein WKF37_21000 [Bryobacteraceae bacterium]